MEVDALTDAVVSHLLSTGSFERVNMHEPKSSPGTGLTAAAWVQSVAPIPGASSLINTSGRVLFNIRIYSNMLSEPEDAIDPLILKAVDELFAAYSADFTLDGLVRNIDLLAEFGIGLTAQAGYMEVGGGGQKGMYRVMTLEVPLIINDLWSQQP